MRRALVVVAVAGAACTTADPCMDGRCQGTDAGLDAGLDAGPRDGGLMDAGPGDGGHTDGGLQDAGPSDSGMEPVDGGSDAGLPYVGHVSIHTLERNGQRIALASFGARGDVGVEGTCAGVADRAGACCFRPPGSPLPPAPAPVSAGLITFKVGATTVATQGPSMGAYFSYQWQAPNPPGAGDTVVVSGAGEAGTMGLGGVLMAPGTLLLGG